MGGLGGGRNGWGFLGTRKFKPPCWSIPVLNHADRHFNRFSHAAHEVMVLRYLQDRTGKFRWCAGGETFAEIPKINT